MRTAIDSNVLSAIWSSEPSAPQLVQSLARARSNGALVISGPVFSEIHAHPRLTSDLIQEFLEGALISVDFQLSENVWRETGIRYGRYAARRRKSGGSEPRGLISDFIIGAHALIQADCFLTLDKGIYRRDFPELLLI